MLNRALIIAVTSFVVSALCAGSALCLDTGAMSSERQLSSASACSPRDGMVRNPVAFIENAGQAPAAARYVVRGPSGAALFGPDGVDYFVGRPGARAAVTLQFAGQSPSLRLEASDRLGARINYLVGSDESRWKRNIAAFGQVAYREVWRGVDVVFRGADSNLKYDIIAEPGADVEKIGLRFAGASSLEIAPDGRLLLRCGEAEFAEALPAVYQEKNGHKFEIPGRFKIDNGVVGFELDGYDASLPLVIDPASDLNWSVLVAGSDFDSGQSVVVDKDGNCYIAGDTNSADLPGSSPWPHSQLADVYVAKVAPDATLVYLTYLGGEDDDFARVVVTDADGNAYVAGYTESEGFPVTPGVLGPAHHSAGYLDGFVAKLSPSGDTLVFSTYIGGAQHDWVLGLALDSQSRPVICGQTSSTDLPVTADASDDSFNGSFDAFVARLSPDAASMEYCTYIGGSNSDWATCLALGANGEAFIGGLTQSTNFPVANAFDATQAGSFDGFVAHLTADLKTLVYSTYLGGSGQDAVHAIAVDGNNAAYVTGTTAGGGFPTTAGAYDTSFNGGASDAFVASFTAAGGVRYSTFLGGVGGEAGHGIAVDSSQRAHVVGQTSSANFPATAGAYSTALRGADDAFLARLSSSAADIVYATYIGGDQNESAKGVALDAWPSAYVIGLTSSPNFPATSVLSNSTVAVYDVNAFLARLLGPVPPDTTPPSTPVVTGDGRFVAASAGLHASWSATDDESGIALYEYAIGTSPSDPGAGYLLPWTSAGVNTEATETGLALQPGTSCYWYVRATNGAGLLSGVGCSDGVLVVSKIAETPAQAKLQADGTFLVASGVVTATSAMLDGRIYIEAADRSSGVACATSAACLEGQILEIAGTMATVEGERIISGASILSSSAGTPVGPLGMRLDACSGSGFFYDSLTGAGQRATTLPEGFGLSPTGLLVAICGQVKSVHDNFVYLDDGSTYGATLQVSRANLPPEIAVASYISAVGLISMRLDDGGYRSVLLVRRPADVTLVVP